jgi:pyruvate dehydrogenase E2 component (dihydrolipoamide acetyltransferase)
MLQSKQSAAHMTVMEEVDVSELIKLKKSHQEQFNKKGTKLTYMPFIMKAVAKALQLHPQLNSEIDLDNNRMVYKKYYNIGIAVDTPDGLVVPVIKDVDKLYIYDLSVKIREFTDRARNRKLTLDDLKNGSFTVTNYGSIGGTFGVPVINYPQAAILGIGRIKKMPVVRDQEIIIGNVLHLSLSVDHRIVDGGEATRFVLKVMEFLKDPVSMFLF